MDTQQDQNKKDQIHQKLVTAAGQHNLEQVKDLLSQGANANYVRYTDANCWYRGNEHTALYDAVHNDFKGDQTNYLNVIQLLLNKGANPNVYVTRGGWNHSTQYPLFNGVSYILSKFKNEQSKIKFIQLFVKHGININQPENHSRSKGWRAYRNNTCFIFSAMDSGGMGSKLREISKLYKQADIQKIRTQKEKALQQQYDKLKPVEETQNNQQQGQNQEEQHQEQQQQQEKQKQKVAQVAFIQSLINFGANPNSSRSSSHWENYSEDYDQSEQRISEEFQTILHRAIMHNQTSLVKLLLQKGAKIQTPCKTTITSLVYPSQWSEQLREKRIKKNEKMLQQKQERKKQLQASLETLEDEEQKRAQKQQIRYTEFEIFKAKKFSIETQCPIPKDQVISFSCMQLTEKLKIKPEIKQLLNIQLFLNQLGLENKNNSNIISTFFTLQTLPDCDEDLIRQVSILAGIN